MSLEATTRKGRGIIDPLITMIYFVPEGPVEYSKIGLNPQQSYFCTRGAALGSAPAELVAATFYNFNPAVVVPLVKDGWSKTTPEAAAAARNQAVINALTRLIAEDDGSVPDVSRAVELVHKATAGLKGEGRPLFAAHYAQPWPEENPLLSLWWGLNLMREYRGDGHIAALLTQEISGIESILLVGPWYGDQKRTSFLIKSRAWPEEQIATAYEGLIKRGILSDATTLTDAGQKLRDEIEATTDHLDLAPWRNLGDDVEEFFSIIEVYTKRLAERNKR